MIIDTTRQVEALLTCFEANKGDPQKLRMRLAIVTLPWPSRLLHPNARVHWAAKARAAKAARMGAAWQAKAVGLRKIDADGLNVTAIFSPPDNRHRDADGMLSSIKPDLDGIADVLGVDDSRWNISIRREPPKKHGAVRIEIEVIQ